MANNNENEIRTRDALIMRLQAECRDLKLQLASRDHSPVAVTFAAASSTKTSTISIETESST